MSHTEMIINHVPGEECRIAIAEDGKLEEFYQERASAQSHVGNIYKGRVVNVEPAIQAAFIDFGLERNGFLHITDLHPKYFPGPDREEFENVGKKTARHERPPIQKCLKRGQDVLVQVLKEGIGTKGPTVTSYLSIPGRFLVMMPDMQRLGVSRKVEDDDARKEMRDILKTLEPPKDFGFIVRTAGIGQTKADLKRDLSYLARLWKDIEAKRKAKGKFGELYAESDLVIRTIRDVFSGDIDRIVCDDPVAARRARDFLAVANPRAKSKVVYYDDPVPVFDRMGIEPQIANISAREVPLPSGGALVIDSTEALVAIDVNSGKSRAARDAETNAYKTNLEAVDEIARQLRLRDLGGLVVLDLIDMRPAKNRKSVENRFKANSKKDRSRTRIGAISQFGLLEMTRQRMRPSLRSSIYNDCAHCTGRGYAMSPESVVLSVMRQLALVMHRDDVARIELTISPDVAFHILNRKRAELVDLESRHGKRVMVRVGGGTVDHIGLAAFNAAGGIAPVELRPRTLSDAQSQEVFRELDDSDLPEPELEADLDDTFFEDHGEDEPAQKHDRDDADGDGDDATGGKRKRRRRRGRGRGESREDDARDTSPDDNDTADSAADSETASDDTDDAQANDEQPRGRRRRRGRRRGGRVQADQAQDATDPPQKQHAQDHAADDHAPATDPDAHDGEADADGEHSDAAPRRRRRRRRGRTTDQAVDQAADQTADTDRVDTNDAQGPQDDSQTDAEADSPAHDDTPAPGRRMRRTRSRRKVVAAPQADEAPAQERSDTPAPRTKKPRNRQKPQAAAADTEPAADDAPPRSRRRRGRKRSTAPDGSNQDAEPNGNRNTAPASGSKPSLQPEVDGNVAEPSDQAPAKPPRRTKRTKKVQPKDQNDGYSNRVVY